MLLPAFAPTAGRLRPQAENARAVFRQPHRNGLAAPAQDRLGEPGAAATVFQRHLRLESTPGGTRHLRCREAQVLHLTGRERRLRKWLPETHGTSCSRSRCGARLGDHLGSYHPAVLLFPEITLCPLGTPPLKGVAQPLAVYRVLYESMARSRLEAVGATGLTRLVGREQEVRL